MFLLHRIEFFWCTRIYKLYQQWERKGTTGTVFSALAWLQAYERHERKLQSCNFPGYKMMLARFLNLAVVISIGSLAVTHLQQSQALCRTTLSTVHALLWALLQVSPAPFWWSLEIQTRVDFSPHLSLISRLLSEALWSTQSLMHGGIGNRGECIPSASKWKHPWVPFLLPFCGEPIKLHGSQYLLETFEVLRGYMLKGYSYCSAVTLYWCLLLLCLGLDTSFVSLLYS